MRADRPQPPGDRRRRIALVITGVAVLVLAGLVVATNRMGKFDPVLGPTGPTPPTTAAAGPQEPHGRRPITAQVPTTGRTITVAKDGSAQHTTIQEAADEAQAGDTVVIAGGEYAESLTLKNDGKEGAPITFQAAPGADVAITGHTDDNGLVNLKGRSYISFVGIAIRGSTNHGFYAVDSQHITLQDCEVSTSGDGGAVFINGGAIDIEHTEIKGNNADGLDASNEAVTFDNVAGFEIAFSIVENNGEEGIDAKYESHDGKIHDNTVNANRGPNIYIDGAQNTEVYDNTVTGTTEETKTGISIGIEQLSESKKASGIKVYNNVIMGNKGGGIGFFVEEDGTFSDIQIVNNTIADNGSNGINFSKYTYAGTNILRNNIFTGSEKKEVSGKTDGFTADHNYFDKDGFGTDVVSGAVTFVDATTGNLRLAADSAGLEAGSTDAAPPQDIAGAPRPSGKVDLGAYQSDPAS
jgi:parallel beta-helix repeat protein